MLLFERVGSGVEDVGTLAVCARSLDCLRRRKTMKTIRAAKSNAAQSPPTIAPARTATSVVGVNVSVAATTSTLDDSDPNVPTVDVDRKSNSVDVKDFATGVVAVVDDVISFVVVVVAP
jgi:hypothetical protein